MEETQQQSSKSPSVKGAPPPSPGFVSRASSFLGVLGGIKSYWNPLGHDPVAASLTSPEHDLAKHGEIKAPIRLSQDVPTPNPKSLYNDRLVAGLSMEDKLINMDAGVAFPLQPEIARIEAIPLDSSRKICIALKSIDNDLSAVRANSKCPVALNGMPVVGILQQVVTQSLRCRLELLLQLRLAETYEQHQKMQDRWTAIRKAVDNVKTMPPEKADSDSVFIDLIQSYENALKLNLERIDLLDNAKSRITNIVSKIGQYCISDVRMLFGTDAVDDTTLEDLTAILGTTYDAGALPNTQLLVRSHTTAVKTLEKLQELCNSSADSCTQDIDTLNKNSETLIAELENVRAEKIQKRHLKSLEEEEQLHQYEMKRIQSRMETWNQYQLARHEARKACIQTGKEQEKLLPQTTFYGEEIRDLQQDIETRKSMHEETKQRFYRRVTKEQDYLTKIQGVQDLAQTKRNQLLNTKRAFNTVIASSLKLTDLIRISTQETFKKTFQFVHDLQQYTFDEAGRNIQVISEYRAVLERRLKQKENDVRELPQQIEKLQKEKEGATGKVDLNAFAGMERAKIKKLTLALDTAHQEIGVITKRITKLETRAALTDSTNVEQFATRTQSLIQQTTAVEGKGDNSTDLGGVEKPAGAEVSEGGILVADGSGILNTAIPPTEPTEMAIDPVNAPSEAGEGRDLDIAEEVQEVENIDESETVQEAVPEEEAPEVQ